jgi:hypothetical protein
MDDMASVFRNNMILPRKDQPGMVGMVTIFEGAGRGDAVVNIDGYAIIPLDVYHALRAQMNEHQFDQLLQTLPSQQDGSRNALDNEVNERNYRALLGFRTSNVTLERSV